MTSARWFAGNSYGLTHKFLANSFFRPVIERGEAAQLDGAIETSGERVQARTPSVPAFG